jgi:hypothetical protein
LTEYNGGEEIRRHYHIQMINTSMRASEFITERKRNRTKSKRSYGGYFYPGYGYGDHSSGEGGGDGGGESISEDNDIDLATEVQKFAEWASKILHIKNPVKIELSMDTEEAQTNHHTGGHVVGSDTVWVYANNRNLVDMLRTVFHELVHVRQGELNMIDAGDSYPGSPIEAMADVLAGKYIKIYGKENNHIFQ